MSPRGIATRRMEQQRGKSSAQGGGSEVVEGGGVTPKPFMPGGGILDAHRDLRRMLSGGDEAEQEMPSKTNYGDRDNHEGDEDDEDDDDDDDDDDHVKENAPVSSNRSKGKYTVTIAGPTPSRKPSRRQGREIPRQPTPYPRRSVGQQAEEGGDEHHSTGGRERRNSTLRVGAVSSLTESIAEEAQDNSNDDDDEDEEDDEVDDEDVDGDGGDNEDDSRSATKRTPGELAIQSRQGVNRSTLIRRRERNDMEPSVGQDGDGDVDDDGGVSPRRVKKRRYPSATEGVGGRRADNDDDNDDGGNRDVDVVGSRGSAGGIGLANSLTSAIKNTGQTLFASFFNSSSSSAAVAHNITSSSSFSDSHQMTTSSTSRRNSTAVLPPATLPPTAARKSFELPHRHHRIIPSGATAAPSNLTPSVKLSTGPPTESTAATNARTSSEDLIRQFSSSSEGVPSGSTPAASTPHIYDSTAAEPALAAGRLRDLNGSTERKPRFATQLIDLASRSWKGGVVFSTDDSLASTTNLICPHNNKRNSRFPPSTSLTSIHTAPPTADAIDGWLTRRRHIAGHEWCIIQLAAPAYVVGFDVHTSPDLAGNLAPFLSIEGAFLPNLETEIRDTQLSVSRQIASFDPSMRESPTSTTQFVPIHSPPSDERRSYGGQDRVAAAKAREARRIHLQTLAVEKALEAHSQADRRQWKDLLPMTEIRGVDPEASTSAISDSNKKSWMHNFFTVDDEEGDENATEGGSRGGKPRRLTTHIRLNLFPDGGISRIRVFGEVPSLGLLGLLPTFPPFPEGQDGPIPVTSSVDISQHRPVMPGAMSGAMPGAIPGAMPGAMSGAMSGAMPGTIAPGMVPGAMYPPMWPNSAIKQYSKVSPNEVRAAVTKFLASNGGIDRHDLSKDEDDEKMEESTKTTKSIASEPKTTSSKSPGVPAAPGVSTAVDSTKRDYDDYDEDIDRVYEPDCGKQSSAISLNLASGLIGAAVLACSDQKLSAAGEIIAQIYPLIPRHVAPCSVFPMQCREDTSPSGWLTARKLLRPPVLFTQPSSSEEPPSSSAPEAAAPLVASNLMGCDWAILKLAARSALIGASVEIDCETFPHQAPAYVHLQACDVPEVFEAPHAEQSDFFVACHDKLAWRDVVPKQPLEGFRVVSEIVSSIGDAATSPSTHLKLIIYPDGGVTGLFVWKDFGGKKK